MNKFEKRSFIAVILGILYIPFGVILELTKKYR